MGKTVIGAYDQSKTATISTTATWEAAYPITRLQSDYLFEKARSVLAATNIVVDLGESMGIGFVAILASNITTSGELRIEASDVSNFATKAMDETFTSYGSADLAVPFTADVSARYWRLSITDLTQSYIELGGFYIGSKITFSVGLNWGYAYGVQSASQVAVTLGGHRIYDERPNARTMQASWSWLNDLDAHVRMLPLMEDHDICRTVYLVFDDEDTQYRKYRDFLATFEQLDAVQFPYLSRGTVGLKFIEAI